MGARVVVNLLEQSMVTVITKVKASMHLCSALSPLLFVIVMQATSREFRNDLLWEFL